MDLILVEVVLILIDYSFLTAPKDRKYNKLKLFYNTKDDR